MSATPIIPGRRAFSCDPPTALRKIRANERKAVLDGLRDGLRGRDFTPIVFDFSRPARRGYGETVRLLAAMARFVIADITDAREVRSELMQVVPTLPGLPVKPILADGDEEYPTFKTDIARYPWVLEPYRYQSLKDLRATLPSNVIEPVEQRWRELNGQMG